MNILLIWVIIGLFNIIKYVTSDSFIICSTNERVFTILVSFIVSPFIFTGHFVANFIVRKWKW